MKLKFYVSYALMIMSHLAYAQSTSGTGSGTTSPQDAENFPDNVFSPSCTTSVEANEFDMMRKFSIDGVNSMTNVVVGDIDGDGTPEILACGQSSESPYYSKNILVIDGKRQKLKFTIETPAYYTYGIGLAIADVNRDGKGEIFLLCKNNIIQCYDYTGRLKWKTDAMDYFYQLSVADINADGRPELICGRYIFNAITGQKLLEIDYEEEGTGFTSPHSFHVSSASYLPGHMKSAFHMFALHDFDNDGTLEMAAGNTLYKINLTNGTNTEGNSFSILRQPNIPDFFYNLDGGCIVADFDKDGDADIIVIASSKTGSYNSYKISNMYVWDGQTDELIAYHTLPLSDRAPSVPFCGDINNDGMAEVCFCTFEGFYAIQYSKEGEGNVKLIHNGYQPFHETSGFTAFDFNQDGKDEFVYHDMEKMYIVDGETLENKSTPVTAYSGTIMEFPVVADVDGDGHAEIVITQGHEDWVTTGNSDGFVAVYGSHKPGAWSSARKVWNQFHYNSVNINEDLTVPTKVFDVSTTFKNGKQPFNAFHKQQPYINKDGDLFNVTSDLDFWNIDPIEISATDDSLLFEGITITNWGECGSISPLCIRVDMKEDTTNVLLDTCIYKIVSVNEEYKLSLKTPMPKQYGNVRFIINPASAGRQPECDFSNNEKEEALPPIPQLGIFVHDTICVESNEIRTDTTHEIKKMNGKQTVVTTYHHYMHSYNETINKTIYEGESYTLGQNEYTETGSYTWEGKTQYGCDSIIQLELLVVAPPNKAEDIFIPTVFTPHHREGKNDIFMAGYEVYIYDRYGNMICHSENGWDGYYRGEVADPGVYIYAIILKDGEKRKGSIEIYK
ncbi:MAG: gliding motility-associated C-terminal domain-containing protein [Paludibacteraceae bacterium]|nr:gliding motility-associated C-terminal domain-containing protein [Paludibacteraceae bacterium]